MALQKIQRSSLVDTVVVDLRRAIENDLWQIGERIPVEGILAQILGVGRNTVREAVRVLVHVGLLETRQGDGTYVRAKLDAGEVFRRIERTELRDQLEVRMMLDAEAARLAAVCRKDQDLEDMEVALSDRVDAREDLEARIAADERFHRAIVIATGNQALIELYRYFSASIERTIRETETDSSLPEPSHEDHVRLFEALRDGDAAAASDIARSLLSPSIQALESP